MRYLGDTNDVMPNPQTICGVGQRVASMDLKYDHQTVIYVLEATTPPICLLSATRDQINPAHLRTRGCAGGGAPHPHPQDVRAELLVLFGAVQLKISRTGRDRRRTGGAVCVWCMFCVM